MREAEEFIGGLQHDEFAADKKTFNAVARAIEVIGEAAKNIPERVPLHGTSRILRQAQDPTLRILEG
jgi:uncharacterized protein with HEPN domain